MVQLDTGVMSNRKRRLAWEINMKVRVFAVA